MTDLADLLKAARSMVAFSRVTTLEIHLLQTCGGRLSCWLIGTSKRAVILVAHPRSSDFLVKRLVTRLSATCFQHSLQHTALVAIAASNS